MKKKKNTSKKIRRNVLDSITRIAAEGLAARMHTADLLISILAAIDGEKPASLKKKPGPKLGTKRNKPGPKLGSKRKKPGPKPGSKRNKPGPKPGSKRRKPGPKPGSKRKTAQK